MSAQPAETPADAVTIVCPATRDRYELRDGKRMVGFTQYRVCDQGRRAVFTHTDIDGEYFGRGLADRLARFALEDMKSRGKQITADCPIIAAYMRLHQDYEDSLDIEPQSTE